MESKLFKYLAFLSFLLFISSAVLANNPDAIIGLWKTGGGSGVVQIYKQGNTYNGKLVWIKEPNDPATGKPKTDVKNKDPKLSSRPIIGLVNLRDFKFIDTNSWKEGKIYDPKTGNDYSCKITMIDENTIEVRGYMGISIIGKTDTWKRQKSL
jgi:uncharacterized protein (DUF2147 family)